MTIRSNDQFNTTIYGYEDRFRGVHGTRSVIFLPEIFSTCTGPAQPSIS